MVGPPLLRLAVAAMALCAGCGEAAPPAPQDRFVDELTEMVLGNRAAVELPVGYRLVQTSAVDRVDRPSGGGDVNINSASVRWLDTAYTQFTFDTIPWGANAGGMIAERTDERLRLLREHQFAPLQDSRDSPARSGAALAVLSYGPGTPEALRGAVARLHGARRPLHLRVGAGCDLYYSSGPAGYVDSLVLLVADAGGTLSLADPAIVRCVFAGHLFNIGFADAVATGRFRQFPVALRRVCGPAAGGVLPPPCHPLFGRRAHLGVASEMVRTGRLRPGRLTRAAFQAAARAQIADIGWPRIVAVQDYEAYALRTLNERPIAPVAR